MNQRTAQPPLRSIIALGVLSVASASAPAEPVDYTGHKIVRAVPQSWAEIEKIHSLGALLLSEAEGVGPVDYVIPPRAMAGLDASGIQYSILHDDVQRLIDEERARLAARGPVDPRDSAWFQDYKDLAAVNAKLNAMVADRPDLVSLLDIGITLQGRHIYGVRISGPGSGKPAVEFNGCHHAREWISVMVPMWIADRFVYEYDTNSSIHSIVDRVEFFIIPVVNLDGYVYTWTTDRLWRKNRRLNAGGCYGVDDNRNYSIGWGGSGSSGYPCAGDYRGTAPFSEPETAAMRDLAVANPLIVATQSFHSYGQMFMSPWGFTGAIPRDNAALLEVDAACAAAITAVHGVAYDYGQFYYTLYQASGNDVDWYYGDRGIFSFTTELRDTGYHAFELPPNEIVPTCEENFAAAMYLAERAATPVDFFFPNGRPSRLDPNTATTLLLEISAFGGSVDEQSPRLHARVGDLGQFTEYSLTPESRSRYIATLPATPCGRTLHYYFSAATIAGISGFSPEGAPAGLYSATAAPFTLLLDADMDNDPAWSVQGQWAWGQPTGGGSYNHDPVSGHTGSNVYGYNLDGDYANRIPRYCLTTPIIDCSREQGVTLDFYRWLGVESNDNYDKAAIEVSNDGGWTWTAIWQAADTGAAVSDSSWQHVIYNISNFADFRPQVRVRWVMGPTDGSVTYPGWNIDDVRVWAPDATPCTGVSFAAGDVNLDGLINAADIGAFVTVLVNPASAIDAAKCCADLNEDCVVDVSDVSLFVGLLLAP